MAPSRACIEGRPDPAHTRSMGFTLVELLVVITIVGMLMAMLLPAVMYARAAGRGIICKSNLHNVGLAMLTEAEAKCRFPASGNFADSLTHHHSWIVNLLTGLGCPNVAEKWNLDLPVTHPQNAELARIGIAVLTCPDDPSVMPGEGNLSYAANGGFGWTAGSPVADCPVSLHMEAFPNEAPIDLNGNGVRCSAEGQQDGSPNDRQLLYQTGLFFPENWPLRSGTVRHHTLDTVLDGLSNTIMLGECLQVGYDSTFQTNWATPVAWCNSFFVSSYVCEGRRCAPGCVNYRRANTRSEHPYRLEAINGALDQPEGQAPWLSSGHAGGVHVVFADGRVQFLAEDVDGAVYASLASPQGALICGPLAQPFVSGSSY